jgi:hypothetical protein
MWAETGVFVGGGGEVFEENEHTGIRYMAGDDPRNVSIATSIIILFVLANNI